MLTKDELLAQIDELKAENERLKADSEMLSALIWWDKYDCQDIEVCKVCPYDSFCWDPIKKIDELLEAYRRERCE